MEKWKAEYPLAFEVMFAESQSSLADILVEAHPLYAASTLTTWGAWTEPMVQWLNTEIAQKSAGWV